MSAEGCGFKCAKATLFGFNFIFWLFSLSVLGAGLWMRMDPNFLERQGVAKLESDAMSLSSGGIILISVAAFSVLLGFFGCCGAAKESRCMLGIYITFLLVILFLQTVAVACGIFSLTLFREAFEQSILRSMKKNLQGSYGNDVKVKELWDLTQREGDCCGADGPIDYYNSTWYKERTDKTQNNTIPVTCCAFVDDTLVDNYKCQTDAAAIFGGGEASKGDGLNTQGCYDSIKDALIKYSKILIGISVGVSAIELLCFILGVFLCCNVGKYSYDYE